MPGLSAASALAKLLPLVVGSLALNTSTSATPEPTSCEDKFRRILNGTWSTGDINNETISDRYGYIYMGAVPRLQPGFPRDTYLTVNYNGKRESHSVLCLIGMQSG